MTQGKTNDAWIELINKHNIIQKVNEEGVFKIKSSEIKEVREPRLMTKFDAHHLLPDVFTDNHLNILPLSRSEFIIGKFKLYHEFPLTKYKQIQPINLPDFESINLSNISSEANAINALLLSRAIDEFLVTDENFSTFNGRMGGGVFSFKVDNYNGSSDFITTCNPQIEIDAGMENSESVVIIEAKNVIHDDFIIRQLYFPYRTWKQKVNKPIRLVFSIYSNKIFRLLEFKFKELENYSSIELIKESYYSLDSTDIYFNEVKELIATTDWIYKDDLSSEQFIFPQANSMEKLFSLLEVLNEEPASTYEIAEIMEFHLRQSDYYYNLGSYLGLMEKFKDEETGKIKVKLSGLGRDLMNKNYRERTFGLIHQFLLHKPFNILFKNFINKKPNSSAEIAKILLDNNTIKSKSTALRRASTVVAILKWLDSIVTKS